VAQAVGDKIETVLAAQRSGEGVKEPAPAAQ
jgi:hypothetical protein